MENKTKAETYVGFAVRSRKYKIGFNAVATMKKAEIAIICKTASEGSKKEGLSLAKKLRCELICFKDKNLEDLVHRENVKIMAISDKALAKAIKEQAAEEFTVVSQENI